MRYEVEPFALTYRAFHKPSGEIRGEFDCLYDAVEFVRAQPKKHIKQPTYSFTLKLEGPFRYVTRYRTEHRDSVAGESREQKYGRLRYVTDYEYAPAADWVITTDDNEIVERRRVDSADWSFDHRSSGSNWTDRWEARNQTARRLLKLKDNPSKIKASCAMVRRYYGDMLDDTENYENPIRGYHRYPTTQHERRITEGHTNEYGDNIVRGSRRWKHIPNSWDDRNCSLWKSERSWKHNSKRRKQWIPR